MDIALAAPNSDSVKSNRTTTNNNEGKECLKLRISTNHVDGTPRIVTNNTSNSGSGASNKNNKVPEKDKNGVVKSSKHPDGGKKDSTSNENHHHQRHHHHSKNHSSSSSGVKPSSTVSKPKDNSTAATAKDNKPKEKSVSSSPKVDGSKVSSKDGSGDVSSGSSINKPKVPSSSSTSSKSGASQINKSSSSTERSSVKDGSSGKPKEGSSLSSSSSSSAKPKEKTSKPQEVTSSKPKDATSSTKRVSSSSSSSVVKTSGSAPSSKTNSSGDKPNSSMTASNNSHHSSSSKSKDSSVKESSKTSSSSSSMKSSSDKKSVSNSSSLKSPPSSKAVEESKAKKPDSSKSKEKPKEREHVDHKDSSKGKAKDSSSKGSSEKVKEAKDIKKEPKASDGTPSSKIKEEKNTSSVSAKVKKERAASDDDDIPLSAQKVSSEQHTSLGSRKATKRPAVDSVSDDDEPLAARPKHTKKEPRPSSSSASKKRKTKEDYSSEDEPAFKKSKKDEKNKKTSTANATPVSSPTKRKKKEEETQEVWKWWEEEKLDDGVKWKKLEHKGPVFAPAYERLPESVKFYYNGEHLKLSDETEEVATFYSKLLDHDYTTKEAFNHNFFKDWRKVMTPKERELITDLKKCDFRKMNAYFLQKTEERKAMTKEEKAVIKKENEEIQKEYGFCTIDGHKEKIGNFKIEPPGLFRGRGEHPKMGRLKKRIFPKEVIINCSKDSKVPSPPKGHKWKEVRNDNTVTWLACWQESIQGQTKYVMLNPSSKLKGEKDWQKYEIARQLKGCVDKIRQTYQQDFRSKEMKIRQRAVALYFIDQLALRAGNEKEEGETADTVGCCSLRVEHITLDNEKDGKQYVVSFDFLGKDSIRYVNSVPVEKRVFKNLHIFMEGKQPSDDLFDRLNTAVLNKHLNELMEGLTAKVFRTYNASKTLQEQLGLLTDGNDSMAAKMLSYNRANRAVAILCNHQRAVPKTFDKSMENLQTKIKAKRDVVKEAEKEYKAAKKEKNKTLMEKKKKALDRLKEQLVKLELQATDKEENKQIALGTSKLNYLDPRITVAWCKKYEVPIEKVYNRTQRDKFRWAIEMVGPDFVF